MEKVSIVYEVLVCFDKMADVAKKFGVSQSCISRIVREAKKSPNFVSNVFLKSSIAKTRHLLIE